ncbi:MAG: Smr/MutS family protein [Thermodesulfobacteriota bacterium]
MNDSDGHLKHNPFLSLKDLLKDKVVLPPSPPLTNPGIRLKKRVKASTEVVAPPVNEEDTFRQAMEGVRPIARTDNPIFQRTPKSHLTGPPLKEPEKEIRQHLENLVKTGQGFIISQTPEYMEGTGRNIPPEITERLHRGDFSIQAHLDLHGLDLEQAKEAFGQFLTESLRQGKIGVLIIHGRGISSPGEPILKNKVREWLTRSHWRKRVIAFTSAQAYDGGAGATYILLRHHQGSKRPKDHQKEKYL